ncbi:Ubiquitin thioesterase OTUB1 (Deubiquitinating enzyme OTUB1) (OTU domain-containing ubiquitin aldehyde-binding protein 1) (Otubain-1) (hOTU1) (Ubiquitin-specific-processing protease OTUB1) [Durusdinium trenchii]|uniref:ubiquitinyl hydrolase 1 n=1 Tax=Durusdinium trenchii TaxID=1381693 RepID=A0ABP0RJD0_9DINO
MPFVRDHSTRELLQQDAHKTMRPEEVDLKMLTKRHIFMEAEAAAAVGPRSAVADLKAQYAENPDFLKKVGALVERFEVLRRSRPDGSCFYRAYLFGIFEQLAGNKELATAFLARQKEALKFCVEAGYEEVAIEGFYDEFMEMAAKVSEGVSTSTLEAMWEENDNDRYLVCWARVLTSAYLKRHEQDFASFLTSHSSIQQFCAQEVDPMDTEADHLQIMALSSFLAVPVTVVYLDRSEGATAEHPFAHESSLPCTPIHLLYRPGHYDLIYTK